MSIFSILLLAGAGCSSSTTQVHRCYEIDNDPENTRIIIAYDTASPEEEYFGVQGTITITDKENANPEKTIVWMRENFTRATYADGAYFLIEEDKITGYPDPLMPSKPSVITGITASEIACEK